MRGSHRHKETTREKQNDAYSSFLLLASFLSRYRGGEAVLDVGSLSIGLYLGAKTPYTSPILTDQP